MRYALRIVIVGIVLALAGSGGALARTAHHHRYGWRYSRAHSGRAIRAHNRIIGNRRTHVYYLSRTRSRLPVWQNRIYFLSTADARAAGYRLALQRPIPINPRLTWQGTRRLPSIGTRHMPPRPQQMDKPVVPPNSQQPPVTPTNPMPN